MGKSKKIEKSAIIDRDSFQGLKGGYRSAPNRKSISIPIIMEGKKGEKSPRIKIPSKSSRIHQYLISHKGESISIKFLSGLIGIDPKKIKEYLYDLAHPIIGGKKFLPGLSRIDRDSWILKG